MTQEYKTLRELDVKPGDVVELKGYGRVDVASIGDETMVDYTAQAWLLDGDGMWRIVSRASDTPKLWRDMTPKEREMSAVMECIEYVDEVFDSEMAQRAREQLGIVPKRETVTLYWRKGNPAHNIQVPGKTDIEHVMDYRMDGDMLYAAGADFEHYYHMKPGDLVTITEMED